MMLEGHSSNGQRLGAFIRLIRKGCMVVMAVCMLLLCGCEQQDAADDILIAVRISDETSSESDDITGDSEQGSFDDEGGIDSAENGTKETNPTETVDANGDSTEMDSSETDAAETDPVDPKLNRGVRPLKKC